VLKDIHSIVLTDEMALKYFGTTQAVGKTLELALNNKFEPCPEVARNVKKAERFVHFLFICVQSNQPQNVS